jgi:hypothetical protein
VESVGLDTGVVSDSEINSLMEEAKNLREILQLYQKKMELDQIQENLERMN